MRFFFVLKRVLLFFILIQFQHIYAQNVAGFKSYVLDSSHTMIGFEISHLVISTVHGQFKTFSGSFDYNEKTQTLKNVSMQINTDSIDTNEPDRDKHLKSSDFFHAEKYPKIVFDFDKLDVNKGKPHKLFGLLSIHGIKKPVVLDVDYKGAVTDPWGNEKIVFNLKGLLNRKDFDLTWNKSLDAGGVMIGDEVTIDIKAEANVK